MEPLRSLLDVHERDHVPRSDIRTTRTNWQEQRLCFESQRPPSHRRIVRRRSVRPKIPSIDFSRNPDSNWTRHAGDAFLRLAFQSRATCIISLAERPPFCATPVQTCCANPAAAASTHQPTNLSTPRENSSFAAIWQATRWKSGSCIVKPLERDVHVSSALGELGQVGSPLASCEGAVKLDWVHVACSCWAWDGVGSATVRHVRSLFVLVRLSGTMGRLTSAGGQAVFLALEGGAIESPLSPYYDGRTEEM